jgi:uncharacterized integral membrane protein (TIGR00698 family)
MTAKPQFPDLQPTQALPSSAQALPSSARALPYGYKNGEGSVSTVFPGMVAVVLIGAAAYWLAQLYPALDMLAMAILLGILARTVSGRLVFAPPMVGTSPQQGLTPGAKLGVKVFIPAGIILLGATLQVSSASAPPGVVLLALVCMLAFFLLIILLTRTLRAPKKSGDLIATGSAACGAPAIAVLSPVIEAEADDFSISVLVITTVGLLGAMLYPLLRSFLGLPDLAFAVLGGATLPQLGLFGSVLAGMSPEIIKTALAVQALRVGMLLVVVVVYAFRNTLAAANVRNTQVADYGRDTQAAANVRNTQVADYGRNTQVAANVRDTQVADYGRNTQVADYGRNTQVADYGRGWFIGVFILLALIPGISPHQGAIAEALTPLAAIVLAFAYASLGLLVDIESVLVRGSRPLVIGLLGWIGVIILFSLIWPLFL